MSQQQHRQPARPWDSLVVLCCVLVGWYVLAWPLLTSSMVPTGTEYPVHITHFAAWQHARACGLCLFWEHTGGGVPFFGDPYSAAQHPFVAVLGLISDPVTTANLTIAAALLVTGMCGWWYAHTMRYPLIPTLWLVGLLLYGGHAVGRLAVGSVALPLAVASFAGTAVAGVRWLLRPDRGRLSVLALALAGLLLAGQGYFQLLAGLWAVPLVGLALRYHAAPLVLRHLLGLVGVVAVLCAPVIVGYVTNAPYMQKNSDEALPAFQSLGYVWANLLSPAPQYAAGDPIAEQIYPYLYSNTIGFVPIVLAVLAGGVAMLQRRDAAASHPAHLERRVMPVWLSLIGVVVVVVSGALQQLLVASGQPALVEAALSWRNVVVVGAAIPIALAMLSGYAVRWLWEAVQRRLPAAPTRQRVVAAFFVLCVAGQIGWLAVAAIPLVETTPIPADSAALVALLADQPLGFVETEQDIQYLAVLRGGHKNFWKLFYPYHLADAYPLVPPRYRIGAADTLPAAGWVEIATVDALVLTANTDPAAGYATTTEPAVVIDRDCRVVSEAGAIALDCSAAVAFPLVVHEYALPGWEAYIDGEPVPLATGDFLAVGVPAGTHRIDFAYRPWLVIAAASLSFVAWVVVCALVLRGVLQQNSR